MDKVATYAAIPAVMKNGYVICAKPKNDMGLERIVVAAPVTVGEGGEKCMWRLCYKGIRKIKDCIYMMW